MRRVLANGSALGIIAGVLWLHPAAAIAMAPTTPWHQAIAVSFTSSPGLLVFHAVFGGIVGLGAAYITARAADQRRQADQRAHEAERRLLESQRMEAIAALSTGVAHDVNNLLGALRLRLRLLRDDPGRAEHHLSAAESTLTRASAMPARLLEHIRHADGEPNADVGQVITGLEDVTRPLLGRSIQWHADASPGLLAAIEPVRLEQLLLNLIVNARDAMPEGGDLFLEAEGRRDSVRLSVRDTGEGIPEHLQDRVFENLFTTKPAGQGTGLGLATCKAIVDEAGGRIALRSRPGETRFEVHLPAYDAMRPSDAPATPGTPSRRRASGPRRRVGRA